MRWVLTELLPGRWVLLDRRPPRVVTSVPTAATVRRVVADIERRRYEIQRAYRAG